MAALLLDLDRTLVDVQSFTDYDAAWRDVVSILGDDVHDLGPDTAWTAATRACMAVLGRLTNLEVWSRVSTAVAVHERAALPRSEPMPGVHEFLQSVADRPTGVVTLLPEGVAREVLERHGLTVDVVVGRDPQVRPKPSGEGLRRALRLLTASSEGATMVGDSSWDAEAAVDAGVGFVGVHTPPEEFRERFPQFPACVGLSEVGAHLV
jgi:phosphoglycolate phosphatase